MCQGSYLFNRFSLTSPRQNLAHMTELGDKSAQGRACGNLGNTHYLLGNFNQAVVYHQEVCLLFEICPL